MLDHEKRARILKELEGVTLTEFNTIKIAFESNLVYLPNCQPHNREAALRAKLKIVEDKKRSADQ